MMGYNEISNQDQLNFLDPFKGANSRKFRPLAPRLNFSPPKQNSCLTSFHAPTTTHQLLSLNNNTNHRHPHHHFEESNSKEVVGNNQVMVSSRWNPTPEQLRALEELYRRGTRTPSAEQIQHITAQLRRYGKIEGKNVFYWFQNHKARERQKRRRQLQLHPSPHGSSTTGGNRVGFEGEQKSCKWIPSTNKDSDPPINQTIVEEVAVISKPSHETSPTSSTTIPTHNNNNNAWIQFHDPTQFQHNHNTNNNSNNNTNDNNISSPRNLLLAGQRNDTWQSHQMVQPSSNMSCSSCCYCYPTSPSLIPFSLNLLPDKQVVNGSCERPPLLSSSPNTLELFPVIVRENGEENTDNNITCRYSNTKWVLPNRDLDDEEDRENEGSLLLLQDNINTCVEKATNNPFPYYEFI